MYSRIGISLAGGLLAAVLMAGGRIQAVNDNVPEGAEVLGRGPIHEAFAQPLEESQAEAGQVAPKAPPEPIEEQPPDQRPEGDAVEWVPGYWQWDEERGEFLWVSGLWRNAPPNRKWVPGSWRQTDKGFQWSNGFWMPETAEGLQYLPPPPATVEEGPSVESPGGDYSYVPGLWVYRDTRYLWRPGYWLHCRPDWIWQPAHYVCTPAGYLYVHGCWDHPLERRGILFAPAFFAGGIYPQYWTPRFAVSIDFLSGALFVRGGHRHYYYGDYFSDGYRRAGFTAWTDYRFGRHTYDPLYSHYRTVHAGRSWDRDVRGLYADRYAGRAERPPRSLAQQNTVIKNATANKTNVTSIKNVTVLRPLGQSAPAQTQLVTVDRAERERQRQRAVQLQTAGSQRSKAEREMIVRKEAPSRTAAAPKSVPIDLPKVSRTQQQPGPRIQQPKPAPRIDAPKPKFEQPKPKFEQPKPKFEQPKPRFEQPKPRIEAPKPKFEQPKPRIEQPKLRIEQPKIQAPKPAPRFEAPKQQFRSNPPPRQAAPQSPAPVLRSPPRSAPPQSRPAPAKPSRPAGKPRR